ncbi:hypothetical protein ACFQJ7_16770 [Halovenus rubra]|uniref:DUF8009 domain-containing protein n=2 Tax=Halovenus rubra TaxID=869890 RepID=A0ABD5XCM4_9EURY|nr:hypothetical protein [Halovenus rubra]
MARDGAPTSIRSLAVTVEDVVSALELNQTTAKQAVLRVTPPFSGRMRARLHVDGTPEDETPTNGNRTLRIKPTAFLACEPTYPTAADTEERLRADSTKTYTVERHHEYHLAAVADWREAVADEISTRTTIQTPVGPHDVEITTLGDLPEESAPKQEKSDG